jgi:hypothetical protein
MQEYNQKLPHSIYPKKIPHLAFKSLTIPSHVKKAREIYGFSHTGILFTGTTRGYFGNDSWGF